MPKHQKQFHLHVTLAAPYAPLFAAHCALAGERPDALAAHAVRHWLTSEEAQQRLDERVNEVLRAE